MNLIQIAEAKTSKTFFLPFCCLVIHIYLVKIPAFFAIYYLYSDDKFFLIKSCFFLCYFQTTLTSHSRRYRDLVTASTTPGTVSPLRGPKCPNMSVIVMQQPSSSAGVQSQTSVANSTGNL